VNELINYALRLGLLCGLSGGLLSWVHFKTAPIQAAREAEERERAKQEVYPLPHGGRFEPGPLSDMECWSAFDEAEQLVGWVFEAQGNGYSSTLRIMVGMDRNGTLAGAKVLSQKETPGLGARIEEVASDWFTGRTLDALFLSHVGGNIDTITGATVTSEAALKAVRETGEKIMDSVKERMGS